MGRWNSNLQKNRGYIITMAVICRYWKSILVFLCASMIIITATFAMLSRVDIYSYSIELNITHMLLREIKLSIYLETLIEFGADEFPSEQIIDLEYYLPERYLTQDVYMNKSLPYYEMMFFETYGKINTVNRSKKNKFQYISDGKWYLIIGRGPDGIFEQRILNSIVNEKDKVTSQSLANIILPYDPTNGIISRGDLYLSSEDLGWSVLIIEAMNEELTKGNK